jgi:hypothetical protein
VGEAARVQERQIEISSVPQEMVIPVWQSQIDMIERGLSKGQGDWMSSSRLLERVLLGKSHLWAIHENQEVIALVIFAVRSNELMTKIIVELLAGQEMPLWSEKVQELLLDFKDIIGADCIDASCRPGLAKYLSKSGWSKKAIIMELI